jgi:cytochrome c-type biogenesis protein CcmH/NrfG
MNDQSAGWSPDSDDEGDAEERRQRRFVERQLMDRARRAAEHDHQERPSRLLQHVIALAAALGLVLVITLGFDAFLTSMQKVMRMIDAEEQRQQQEEATPNPEDPMPAYVVPAD